MAEPDSIKTVETQDLLALVRSQDSPRELRVFAARGLLPLERDDRLRALLAVIGDIDPDIGPPAAETLARVPPDDLARFLDEAEPTEIELDVISRHSDDHFVLERIIRNRAAGDQTLLALASIVSGAPQEALIVNQVRLLRQPALIDALLENPVLAADGRRRLLEMREEFFDKEERRKEQERLRLEEEERRARQEAAGIVFDDEAEEEAEGAEGEAAAPERAPRSPTRKPTRAALAAVFRRISMMTVKEKLGLAQRGTKEERRILIGDVNKIVSIAVLRCESTVAGRGRDLLRHAAPAHRALPRDRGDAGMGQAAPDPARPRHQPGRAHLDHAAAREVPRNARSAQSVPGPEPPGGHPGGGPQGPSSTSAARRARAARAKSVGGPPALAEAVAFSYVNLR